MNGSHSKPFAIPTTTVMAKVLLLISATLLIAACSSQRPLMPTPDVYALGIKQPFEESLPSELRTVDANIMYVTDRVPEPREDGRLDYGLGREHAQAFGDAVVRIGGDATWEELATDARNGVRSNTLNLSIVSVEERTRAPRDSLIFFRADGTLAVTDEARPQLDKMTDTALEMISSRLALSTRKEVLIFVHGVKTDFDDALFTTAELWHYLGREFVPIAYSWPAGHGGLLRGYTYDRESSEFTVFHFKRFLAWLAEHPELEGINIIAHSRGTDIVQTAIRELTIEARASGMLTQDPYKLRNIVIAAPDINLEIALQRTEREGTVWAADRWTTYTSPHDKAIGVSEWLFGGLRFGKAGFDSVSESFKQWMTSMPQFDETERDAVIQYDGRTGGMGGHNYFRTNPAVASDLVLTVRYGLPPGAENGRPLEHVAGFFWTIDDNYLDTLKSR